MGLIPDQVIKIPHASWCDQKLKKKTHTHTKDVKDPEKIKELIEQGKFVMKELEALYFLRKYRAMKQRYYSDTNKTK